MKRILYTSLFTFLGLLLSFLLHALLEMAALSLILSDYGKYSATPLGQYWSQIHDVASLLLTIVGVTVGFLAGRYFWPIMYPSRESRK